MKGKPTIAQPRSAASQQALDELQAIRRELAALRRLVDQFAGVFLNAKFPHGRPTDRWGTRRG